VRERWLYLGLKWTSGGRQVGEIFRTSTIVSKSRYPQYDQVVGPFSNLDHLQGYVRDERLKLKNPPEQEVEEIYGSVLAIEARKGKNSLWPRENFRHDFSAKGAKVYGLKDGSLLIKGRKRLWKKFSYRREDI